MNIEKFTKDMGIFAFGQHQDTLTYLNRLEKFSWTIKDVREYLRFKKKEVVEPEDNAKPIKIKLKNCPLCRRSMHLLNVNISPATQTGDDSKTVWLCPNQECMHTIYNKETLEELSLKEV